MQDKIDELLRQKRGLEDKFRVTRRENRKYQEESISSQRQVIEKEWRLEAQNQEMSNKDSVIAELKKDKLSLERKVDDLQ